MSARARTVRHIGVIVGAVATLLLGVVAGGSGATAQDASEPALPIVFVHGFSGSGAQYETQALRFASNGYPNLVTAIDRTSTFPSTIHPILDDFFDDVLEQTGADQLYAVGHSAGTFVMSTYLNSSPERAARVAKYIGIDGGTAEECPGDVECLGVWARGNPARQLGDNNVYFPDQGHTESVGSPESFAAQYEFLTGHPPATTDVLPEPPGQVEISGRALDFPANTGMDGSLLEVWKVNPNTGVRADDEPVASVVLGPDGNFGPVKVNGRQRYEIALLRFADDGTEVWRHFYYEPWIRDNHLIRLNLSPIGSPLSEAIEEGPYGSVSIVRQREWWGDNPVDADDVDDLFVSTESDAAGDAPPIDIINGATAPYTASTIAVIGFDIGNDQATDVSQLFPLGPFLSGVDVYMPAVHPPDGVVTFEHHQRGFDRAQVINTPNWESESHHTSTITFRDWEESDARPNRCASKRSGC